MALNLLVLAVWAIEQWGRLTISLVAFRLKKLKMLAQ